MRYPDGGGLSAAGRARREQVQLRAAELFSQGITPLQVAARLRVSPNSAYVWRRRWRAGGEAALASKGPGGAVCRLSGAQLARRIA
jgi:transposase